MAINLQTIEGLPLVEEVTENTTLVGWDGTQTVRVAKDKLGTGLPSGGEPYMQLVTDGEGKWVAEQRLGYTAANDEVIVPEQTLTTDVWRMYNSPFGMNNMANTNTVIFDGVAYPVT